MTSDSVEKTEQKGGGVIAYRPATRSWFGLKKTESNFELFVANMMIEHALGINAVIDRLDKLIELQTPKPKAKRKTRAKAKVKSKTKSKAKKRK